MSEPRTRTKYSFSSVGNRLSSLGVASYTNNTSNELTSTSNASYTYDNNSNTTSKTDSTGTTNYSWDFENRLTQVTLPGTGGTESYRYDPFGRRIQKAFTQSGTTTTTNYLYDGDNAIETVDQNGSEVSKLSQGQNIDEPLAESTASGLDYYERDGLGSVTSLTNASGAVAQTYTYDSFGKLTNSSGSVTNPFRYVGRDFDAETGLYYYRARYYDPTTGRFLSEDPLESNAGNNFYEYSYNNPNNVTDPSGLQAQPIWVPPPPPLEVLTGGGGAAAGGGSLLAGGLVTLDVGLATYDAYQLYNLGQAYGWWNDFLNSGNMQQVRNPNRAKCQNGCQPCVPPVGSLRYRIDQVPPSRPHKPWPGTHWHIEQMQQAPAPACTCFWKEVANGQGQTPPGVPQK